MLSSFLLLCTSASCATGSLLTHAPFAEVLSTFSETFSTSLAILSDLSSSKVQPFAEDTNCATGDFAVSLACNGTYVLCPSGAQFNASADLNTSATVPAGALFDTPEEALDDAFFRVFSRLDSTPTALGCGCGAVTSFPTGSTCDLNIGYCPYFESAAAVAAGVALLRARAWDMSAIPPSSVSGHSAGYDNPSAGSQDPYFVMAQAADDLRANHPERKGCGPVGPLVMFPGYTSSTLNYTLLNSPPPAGHPLCRQNTDGWQQLYPPSAAELLQPACWFANLAFTFDDKTGTFFPLRENQKTITFGFGGTDGLPDFAGLAMLMRVGGYRLGETLFLTPFDWRLPPSGQESFFDETKELVERASELSGGAKVSLWAFSGGPQMTLSFLHRMTQTWKDQYVNWFVATSPVWGGLPQTLPALTSGISQDGAGDAVYVQSLVRSAWPTVVWYLPRTGTDPATSWTRDEVVIATPTRNYSAFDALEILKTIGVQDDLSRALPILYNDSDLFAFAAPGVPTFVTYGSGLPTPYSAVYDEELSSVMQPPRMLNGSGDGLVPLRSSLRGTTWITSNQGKALLHKEYPKQPHASCFWTGAADTCATDVFTVLRTGALPRN